MAKFLLDVYEKVDFSIDKNTVEFLIDFTLPDHVRENMAADDIRAVDGIFTMSFYSDPHVGDYIKYRGHEWRILGRCFLVSRYRIPSDPRAIPKLIVEYVGVTPNDGWP